MQTIHSPKELQNIIIKERSNGKRIGFVPTMGALHEGHISLVREARKSCDILVLSIFVNPLQFAPSEDLDQYPRTLDEDSRLAQEAGVDFILAPSPNDMYPNGYDSTVSCGGITERLEGESRPGHFDGVTTVVLKLFNIVQPHFAVFGQKDAQQSLVIRRMVEDLNVPVEVIVAPTVRENDGLAMSSRNRYLTKTERDEAAVISEALHESQILFKNGEESVAVLLKKINDKFDTVSTISIEYVALTDLFCNPIKETIETDEVLLSIACRTGEGNTRLIDNVLLK